MDFQGTGCDGNTFTVQALQSEEVVFQSGQNLALSENSNPFLTLVKGSFQRTDFLETTYIHYHKKCSSLPPNMIG